MSLLYKGRALLIDDYYGMKVMASGCIHLSKSPLYLLLNYSLYGLNKAFISSSGDISTSIPIRGRIKESHWVITQGSTEHNSITFDLD